MLNITATAPAHLDLSDMNFVLSTGQSGAPAALPAVFPTMRQLNDEEPEEREGWSS